MRAAWPRDREKVADAKIDKESAQRVWRFASPYRRQVVGFLVTVVIQALLGIVPAILFGLIIDEAIPQESFGLLWIFSALIVGAAIISGVVSLVERYVSSRIGEGVIYDLRVALFNHVQNLPLAFFTRTQTGRLTNRLNNDVIGAQRALTATLGTVVSNVIILATTLVAMFIGEWRLTLLALALSPLFLFPYRWVGGVQQKITKDAMDVNASMNSTMTERFNVSGALLVKLFGRGKDELEGFSSKAASVRDIGIRSALFTRGFLTMLTLVGALGTALVYSLGGYFVISGSFTIGQLATMGLLVGRIYTPLTALSNARVDVLTALVSFDRVFEVLDAKSPLSDSPNAKELVSPEGEIEFSDVSFAYPNADEQIVPGLETELAKEELDIESETVLKDISFIAKPGQTIALVGPSGAGKSTMLSLIPRLYDATSGQVLIDGQNVKDLTQESVRAAIGVVNQDPHLFHESIGDNLRYAKPEATDTDLETACRAAQIWELISSLPAGLDTVVGERGYRMSGGEKQRLAIARMLLKDPTVVVLDEATSHLDSENEQLVQQALAEALDGRTALVIAHRLSTIVEADQILVLEKGVIVERGTHSELLANNSLYADLYSRLVKT